MAVTDRMLEACELFRFFHAADDDETVALRGVSLSVAAGEIAAVVGPSGSGKSTLLSCLAGLDVPDAGTIAVDGRRMSRRSEVERAALRADHIGMVFQANNLFEHLTVAQNVALAERTRRRPGRRAQSAALLDRLGIADRAAARPSQLSGGETARAGLAVALANSPSVLLADEPTGELDHVRASSVFDLLSECAHGGMAVVVVTHDTELARRASHAYELRDGVLV